MMSAHSGLILIFWFTIWILDSVVSVVAVNLLNDHPVLACAMSLVPLYWNVLEHCFLSENGYILFASGGLETYDIVTLSSCWYTAVRVVSPVRIILSNALVDLMDP